MFRNCLMRSSDMICILGHYNRFHPMHLQGNWLNRVLHSPRRVFLGLGEDLRFHVQIRLRPETKHKDRFHDPLKTAEERHKRAQC